MNILKCVVSCFKREKVPTEVDPKTSEHLTDLDHVKPDNPDSVMSKTKPAAKVKAKPKKKPAAKPAVKTAAKAKKNAKKK